MGQNICKQFNWQWINFQNIQATHSAQYKKKKKIKQPNQKLVDDLNRHFSKKVYIQPKSTWKDIQYQSLLEKCK